MGLPQEILPVEHTQNTPPRRYPAGMLVRCLNNLNWLISVSFQQLYFEKRKSSSLDLQGRAQSLVKGIVPLSLQVSARPIDTITSWRIPSNSSLARMGHFSSLCPFPPVSHGLGLGGDVKPTEPHYVQNMKMKSSGLESFLPLKPRGMQSNPISRLTKLI